MASEHDRRGDISPSWIDRSHQRDEDHKKFMRKERHYQMITEPKSLPNSLKNFKWTSLEQIETNIMGKINELTKSSNVKDVYNLFVRFNGSSMQNGLGIKQFRRTLHGAFGIIVSDEQVFHATSCFHSRFKFLFYA